MKPVIISTVNDLTHIIHRAVNSKRVALDTEFIWEKTFYPQLGIIQLGLSEQECYIIDVLQVDDLSLLGKLIADPTVLKVLHDAQQDLTILRRATGCFPHTVFDTQCAAGFIGFSSSSSLNFLLQAVLRISLSKKETRSNWLKRPLSKKQISYALNDVRFLLKLSDGIRTRVREKGHELWLQEELHMYENQTLYSDYETNMQYLKISGNKQLSARELTILRELADWRENEARQQNIPREHVLTDKVLLKIAKEKPLDSTNLKPNKVLLEKKIRQYGKKITKLVKDGLSIANEECLKPMKQINLDDAAVARVDFAMAFIRGTCINKGVDPALVTSRSEIISLIDNLKHSDTLDNHKILQGWRKECVGDSLLKLLQGKYTMGLDPQSGLPLIVSSNHQEFV